jgi:FKBP-type peptidyl-prolyl cis-trans isomerase FklB
MRYLTLLLVLSVTSGTLFAEDAKKGDASELKTVKQKGSYALGVNIGKNIASGKLELDIEAFTLGVADVLADRKIRIGDEALQKAFQELFIVARKKQADKNAALLAANAAFLPANAKKESVTVTKSGLQYAVLKKGLGAKPKRSDTVRTAYRGTLVDGTEFDSSKSATFRVDGVIAGWTEALQLMPIGSKWKLFIPSELAYGKRGYAPDIGPDAVLIFDIELLEIVK